MDEFMKSYIPFHSPNDPCPPIGKNITQLPHTYLWAFNHLTYPNSHQKEALRKGTLWPAFYDFYENPYKKGR